MGDDGEFLGDEDQNPDEEQEEEEETTEEGEEPEAVPTTAHPTVARQVKTEDVKAGSIGIRLEDELFQLSRGFRSPTGPIFTEEYWRQFSTELTVSAGEANQQSVGTGIGKTARKRRAREITTWLREEGYFVDEPEDGEIERPKLRKMVQTIRALKRAGWPSVFAFVFDEVWEMFRRIWPLMTEVLGGECVLEPSFFVYALEAFQGQQKVWFRVSFLFTAKCESFLLMA